MQVGDLIRVINPKVKRLLRGGDPGFGIIVSISTNMVKVRFLTEGPWCGETKPLAKAWVEVVNESR